MIDIRHYQCKCNETSGGYSSCDTCAWWHVHEKFSQLWKTIPISLHFGLCNRSPIDPAAQLSVFIILSSIQCFRNFCLEGLDILGWYISKIMLSGRKFMIGLQWCVLEIVERDHIRRIWGGERFREMVMPSCSMGEQPTTLVTAGAVTTSTWRWQRQINWVLHQR